MAGTGVGVALGVPACAALDLYIGGLAFIESGNSIEASGCSTTRKRVAHVANFFNLVGEPSTQMELTMFAIQVIAANGC